MCLPMSTVVHGQHLWGIPKEHAQFEWQEKDQGSTVSDSAPRIQHMGDFD